MENQLSCDSRNEFIYHEEPETHATPQIHPQEFTAMMNYMKFIYTDPVLREKMKEHVMMKMDTSVQLRQSPQLPHPKVNPSHTPTNHSHNATNHTAIAPTNHTATSHSHNATNHGNKSKLVINSPRNEGNQLSNYLKQSQSMAQSSFIPQMVKTVPFDDQPIMSSVISKMNLSANERAGNGYQSYMELDERPICGLKKDFKETIKEQFPFNEEKFTEEERPEVKRPVSFLKKGSRQHLSSAKDKGVESKPQPVEVERPGRSISQNRVLGKKNADRSLLKKEGDRPYIQEQDRPKPVTRKVDARVETKLPVKFELKQTKAKVDPSRFTKTKAKNVFEDQTESESSEEEEISQAKNFPASKPSKFEAASPRQVWTDKIEVLPNLYLRPNELKQIINKHSKPQPPNQALEQIRCKYTDLCNLLELERVELHQKAEKEKDEFEAYKMSEISKVKNEKRVMERQLKSSQPAVQSYKEEMEQLKRDLQKEREESKKRDKTNRIIIEKQKKEIEELKHRLEEDFGEDKKSYSNVSVKKPVTEEGPYSNASNASNVISVSNGFAGDKSKVSESGASKKKQRFEFVEQEAKRKPKEEVLIEHKLADSKSTNSVANSVANSVVKSVASSAARSVASSAMSNIPAALTSHSKPLSNYIPQSSSESEEQTCLAEYSPTMQITDLTRIPLDIHMVSEKMVQNLFRFGTNNQYKRYLSIINSPLRKVVNTTRNSADGKVTHVYSDRSKEVVFENGTRRQNFQDGYTILYFRNGDVKQKLSDGTVLYYFREKEVYQITLTNGVDIYRFDNNQVEFHFKGGSYTEIRHPDGTIKVQGQKE